ncbi:hypothetical protein [Peribacillus simplex]|uniref:hypothetical protein n=1 Tax=Peribacillus simplex TaxID=1478 RepID=UPI0011A4F95C|nr:hypothetical protein [Peribacillus simplex]
MINSVNSVTTSQLKKLIGQQRDFNKTELIKNFSSEKNGKWATEPNEGRIAYMLPYRVDKIKSLGNAVVSQ